MQKLTMLFAIACVSVWAVGCSGTEGERINPDIEAVKSQDYNPEDLRINVETGVRKLVQKVERNLGRGAFAGRPIVFVAPVTNRTDEHIDPKMIQNYLETEFTDRVNVRLVDRARAMEIAQKELLFQQGSLVDPGSAQQMGKNLGAKYFIFAELSNHRTFTRSGKKEGQLFYFNIALIAVETLEKIPTNVKIQKVATKGTFGY